MRKDDLNGNPTALFRTLRDRAISARGQSVALEWPKISFNWALDWFDHVPCSNRTAVIVVAGDEVKKITYAELARGSNQIANLLRERGVARQDRVLVAVPN